MWNRLMARAKDSSHFGLIGMQERVELLKGKMDIESARGQGTKITISIPDEYGFGKERDHMDRKATGSRKIKVLLADDHQLFREGLKRILNMEERSGGNRRVRRRHSGAGVLQPYEAGYRADGYQYAHRERRRGHGTAARHCSRMSKSLFCPFMMMKATYSRRFAKARPAIC